MLLVAIKTLRRYTRDYTTNTARDARYNSRILATDKNIAREGHSTSKRERRY
jgi:hypothetical protein